MEHSNNSNNDRYLRELILLVRIFLDILVIEKTPNEYENCYLRTFMRDKNKENFFEDLTLLSDRLSAISESKRDRDRRLGELPRHQLALADQLCCLYFGIITDDNENEETYMLNAMEYFIMLDVSYQIKQFLKQE